MSSSSRRQRAPEQFIFLEFTNPKVRNFLGALRAELTGRDDGTPAHITVRGPYKELPKPDLLEMLDEKIRGFGVVIGGAGTFSNGDSCVVYLKAQSPVFKEIWWKRDFPTTTFGIQPHISVFETANSEAAKRVERFLRSERMEISTFGLRLAVYAAKQPELFEVDSVLQIRRALADWERFRVRAGILDRAKQLRGQLLSVA